MAWRPGSVRLLLGVWANGVAIHVVRDIPVRTVDGRNMKLTGNYYRLSKRHLCLLIPLELDVDHLIWRRWRHVNAGACERYEEKLSDLIDIILQWNHETGDGDHLVVERTSRGVWLCGVEGLECRPTDSRCD